MTQSNVMAKPMMSSYFSSPAIALSNAHVLVVDDDVENYHILKALLKKTNIHNTSYAATMENAWEILEKNPPDMILLDIMMPDISGFDFCAKLKQMPAHAKIPVIFISALSGAEVRTKAFRLGGVDYLQKPYNLEETMTRIHTHLQNGLFRHALEKQAATLRHDLDLGAKVQQSLLPDDATKRHMTEQHNCKIASAFIPSGALAGDFWQLLPIDNDNFAIALCDFSGHGVASALETARFHSLIYELRFLWSYPVPFIQALNARMHQMLPPETFATFNYAVINSKARTARIISAGGPSFMHVQGKHNIKYHHQPALPLSIAPEWQGKTSPITLQFNDGDNLVFYSDALTELSLKDAHADPFSKENEKKLLALQGNVDGVCHHIVQQFHNACAAARNDDLTLICCGF